MGKKIKSGDSARQKTLVQIFLDPKATDQHDTRCPICGKTVVTLIQKVLAIKVDGKIALVHLNCTADILIEKVKEVYAATYAAADAKETATKEAAKTDGGDPP